MEQLRCAVERITYRNEENGYTVLRCRARGFQDLVTVVGVMPETHVGSILQLEGDGGRLAYRCKVRQAVLVDGL